MSRRWTRDSRRMRRSSTGCRSTSPRASRGRWSRYLASTRDATKSAAETLLADVESEARDEVTLTDFDPDGEIKIVAAALYPVTDLPDDQLLARARRMTAAERLTVLQACV